ncbi:HTH-type transcriptional repressor CytR [compost metagenome]
MVMVTRKDVAQRAGVSVAVVSYVLNDRKIVKEETKQKVLKVIEELGYEPNLLARSLKTKRTNQLAVLVNNLGNPFETGILLSLEYEASKAGYFTFFQTFQHDNERELRTLLMGRVDGIVLLGQSLSVESINHFHKLDIPLVSITKPVTTYETIPYIDIDWLSKFRAMISHFKEQSHTRIGFMAHSEQDHYLANRYNVFVEAMRLEGLEYREGNTLYGDGRYESGLSSMKKWLEEQLTQTGELPIRALLCANDMMAVGSLAACHEVGISVPGQLAIARCEQILMSDNTSPKLTCLHYPRAEAGILAVQMLLEQINGSQPSSHLLESELIKRESTGIYSISI